MQLNVHLIMASEVTHVLDSVHIMKTYNQTFVLFHAIGYYLHIQIVYKHTVTSFHVEVSWMKSMGLYKLKPIN